MAVQLPPGFAQFSVEHLHADYGRPAVTTWGVDLAAAGGDADDLATQFQAGYVNTLGLLIDSEVTIANTRVYVGQDGPDPDVGIATTTGAGGATGRDTSPPALAVMIDVRTNKGGRRNRGRKYLPWAIGDSDVNELGQISSAYQSAAQARCADFLDDIAANGWSLVVLHGAGVSGVPVPTPVTSLQVAPIIRTQKQRQIR